MIARDLYPCIIALTTSFALAAGCDPMEQDGDFDEVNDADDADDAPARAGSGGIWLNTSAIGDHAFSALDLKKGKHDGVRLDRVLVKHGTNKFITVDRVKAVNGEIQAGQGTTNYFGQQLVGSKWELTLIDGLTETPAVMWISSATNVKGAWYYTFQHLDEEGNLADLCEPDPGGSAAAVPIDNITVDANTGAILPRQNTLYLACTSGAIGKAVTWGYRPWQITVPEFEAAVRVVRADYCGDGVSWTVPGSTVQLKDVWGFNNFADASASNEAVWGSTGALCLAQPRSPNQEPITCGGVAVPSCAANVGLHSFPGALYWTKLAPL